MKIITAAFLLTALSLSSFAAENRKLECERTSADQIILPAPSHRIIFVAKKAIVEIKEENLYVSLQGTIGWNFEIAIKSQSDTQISAKNSERVYPSGNIARSYTKVTTVKLTDVDSHSPKLVVKSEDKSLFKGNDLRYFGEYDCKDL